MFAGNNVMNGEGPSAATTGFISPSFHINRTMSPYPDSMISGRYSGKLPPYAKRSMNFLSMSDLFGLKAFPVIGGAAYLGTSLPAMAYNETFLQ